MPSLSKINRLCIIGDSQMGSLRQADEAGLIRWPRGVQVEYWGATGPLFRKLHWIDGGLEATGDAEDIVKKINTAHRTRIDAADFDTILFYGARLRMAEFFAPLLQWRGDTGSWPSRAVLKASALQFAISVRAFRSARSFAEAGVRVIFVPSPFYTDGVVDMTKGNGLLVRYPAARAAGPLERAHLWGIWQEVASDAGIAFVAQPDDTVVHGMFTENAFACDNAEATGDFGHKSDAFAVRLMEDAIPLIASVSRAA